MRRAAFVLRLALAVALPAGSGLADTAAPAGEPVLDALPVRFELEQTTLTSERLRLALEQELRVRVGAVDVLSSAGLSIRVQRRKARVSFTTGDGESITRTVELSGDDARSSEIVALLAGNLARDQASELLSTLAPIEPEPDASAADTPEPEAEKSEPEPRTARPDLEQRKETTPPKPEAAAPAESTSLL